MPLPSESGRRCLPRKINYAIAESAEPGSTFKLASYLVGLDDGKFDLNDMVDTENGRFKIYRHTIRDSHEGGGVMTVKQAFEESSNVAITKLIYENYKDNPASFTKKLHELHLEPLGLQIQASVIALAPKRSWTVCRFRRWPMVTKLR